MCKSCVSDILIMLTYGVLVYSFHELLIATAVYRWLGIVQDIRTCAQIS